MELKKELTTIDISKNLLFKGDNLEILKLLEKTHHNSIKCIYIDPPYNTQENRKHFRDTWNSCEWEQMMKERLLALKSLLTEDGSLWMSIDDSELHTLKKISQEIFGHENYLATITWQHKINWTGYRGKFQLDHSYIIGFQKSDKFRFVNNEKPKTVWLESEAGGQSEAIQESINLFGIENTFSTPKPEKLIKKIIMLTTNENDIVLDCFAGSGTTGAAAQKCNRRWILIEMGQQCDTHILKRLNKLCIQIDPFNVQAHHSQKDSDSFYYFSDADTYKFLTNL